MPVKLFFYNNKLGLFIYIYIYYLLYYKLYIHFTLALFNVLSI